MIEIVRSGRVQDSVETSVVMPTLYLYLSDMGKKELYGFTLSLFNMAGLIAKPLFGAMSGSTKPL